MTNTPCPECGRLTAADAPACPNCGHALMNGTVARPPKPPPPELEGYVFEEMTPEIEALLGPFNMEEFLAEVREIEETGGVKFEDFIGEIEEIVKRRE